MWLFGLESAQRKRDRCNWVYKKESLKHQWLHLNSANLQILLMALTLIMCWCCHNKYTHGISSFRRSQRHKMPSRTFWHPPALPDEHPGPSTQANWAARTILNTPAPLFCVYVCTYLPVLYEDYHFWKVLQSLNWIHNGLSAHCVAFYSSETGS